MIGRRESLVIGTLGRTPLLSVESISCGYGVHPVLRDVSFGVEGGEFVGMIGPNGSGKSTLLKLLMNLIRPTGGNVRIAGTPVSRLSTPELSRLGVTTTFQDPRVFGALSVLENMTVAHRGRSTAPAARARALELLDRVSLAPMANRKARELSGGQQKLLDLVRAAARRPRLFILDEVTAGVHPDLIPTVMEVISDCARLGAAVLLVTHEMEIARSHCSRLLALHNGQIIADGTPDEVLAHERVVEAYLGS